MLNVLGIMGRLTADPELRNTQQGTPVCSFTIANDKPGKDKGTNFIDCVAWRSTAEFLCKWFHKGSMVAIDGCLQTRSYQDKNGNNRKATEIVANNVSFCGSKDSNPGSQNASEGYQRGAESVMDAGPAEGFAVIDDPNEDLPF